MAVPEGSVWFGQNVFFVVAVSLLRCFLACRGPCRGCRVNREHKHVHAFLAMTRMCQWFPCNVGVVSVVPCNGGVVSVVSS